VSACATCDGFFFRGKEIAVVGGGDTAMEEALYLTRFATKVHLLHRRAEFRASRIMEARAEREPRIEIHRNASIVEVLGDASVTGLRLRDTKTDARSELPVEGLFVAIGYRPNTGPFEGWLEKDEAGYLTVHAETHSRIDGVFVAGDVHDHRYRQAVTAAGDGCRAAIDAERWLAENTPAEVAATTTG
jgi:thioredoxin reductase (NADPH)